MPQTKVWNMEPFVAQGLQWTALAWESIRSYSSLLSDTSGDKKNN
jgi:hypothetical protein